MVNLIWKDFVILKRYLIIAPIYGFLVCFAFSHITNGALSAVTVGVSYMLVIQTCLLDDKNKSELMLNSLPLHRKDIVFAKYLSCFVYAVLAILFFGLAQLVISFTGIPILEHQITLEGIAGAMVAMMILISFYFPFYFKLGYLRSRMVGMIMLFSCFFLIPLLRTLFVFGLEGTNNSTLRNIVTFMQRLVSWLQTLADWQVAGYILSLAIILMACSVSLSLRFYIRREF
ncbi:ABC-2 transporter permease [Desulfosporosinus sp. OT]|uniref:ABC-2 transporter permease n=1 Tax=Desulfosporosinus sp. OT TaxID=913865 RepID=UPI0002239AC4|nr:ABC-2 transporter permease [Desulfosporosinus sp. OT]EGW41651.1 putative membrane protein [Desulfosporosinus sp. OT]